MTRVTNELQNNTHTHRNKKQKKKPLVMVICVVSHLERGWKGNFVTDFCLWDIQTVIPFARSAERGGCWGAGSPDPGGNT